ncbi:MAG: DUF1801 domain-containing protein [Myxococcales bacterium]|nr:DUF1801 domain-containing protein [Myxococcales bacterium]MCB9645459.1 DUF1801 domain-containing protein [Deltaproteobacteria bacterium]
MKRRQQVSVDGFLSRLEPPVVPLVQAARACIMAAVPHATERVRPGWQLIGYNAPTYFAFIAPDRDGLRVGFEWGVLLDDPAGLLEGTGRQVRFVPIRHVADLGEAALTRLLRAAAALPPRRAMR